MPSDSWWFDASYVDNDDGDDKDDMAVTMTVMIDYFGTNSQIMMMMRRMIVMIVYLGQTARYLVYLSLPSPPQAQWVSLTTWYQDHHHHHHQDIMIASIAMSTFIMIHQHLYDEKTGGHPSLPRVIYPLGLFYRFLYPALLTFLSKTN